MRELNFRGISDKGVFIYGGFSYLEGLEDTYICRFAVTSPDTETGHQDNYIEPVPVDFKTVGQYTGIKDKKRTKDFPYGQKIYEGDVCKNDIWWDKPRIIGFNCLGHVCSIDEEGSEWSFSIDTAADIEIIGNIHEMSQSDLNKWSKYLSLGENT